MHLIRHEQIYKTSFRLSCNTLQSKKCKFLSIFFDIIKNVATFVDENGSFEEVRTIRTAIFLTQKIFL